ncbi:hypothetical protein HHI36_009560, partial [Cryptolaemus montrouzieri]
MKEWLSHYASPASLYLFMQANGLICLCHFMNCFETVCAEFQSAIQKTVLQGRNPLLSTEPCAELFAKGLMECKNFIHSGGKAFLEDLTEQIDMPRETFNIYMGDRELQHLCLWYDVKYDSVEFIDDHGSQFIFYRKCR